MTRRHIQVPEDTLKAMMKAADALYELTGWYEGTYEVEGAPEPPDDLKDVMTPAMEAMHDVLVHCQYDAEIVGYLDSWGRMNENDNQTRH